MNLIDNGDSIKNLVSVEEKKDNKLNNDNIDENKINFHGDDKNGENNNNHPIANKQMKNEINNINPGINLIEKTSNQTQVNSDNSDKINIDENNNNENGNKINFRVDNKNSDNSNNHSIANEQMKNEINNIAPDINLIKNTSNQIDVNKGEIKNKTNEINNLDEKFETKMILNFQQTGNKKKVLIWRNLILVLAIWLAALASMLFGINIKFLFIAFITNPLSIIITVVAVALFFGLTYYANGVKAIRLSKLYCGKESHGKSFFNLYKYIGDEIPNHGKSNDNFVKK